jgi:hypothetical protein
VSDWVELVEPLIAAVLWPGAAEVGEEAGPPPPQQPLKTLTASVTTSDITP